MTEDFERKYVPGGLNRNQTYIGKYLLSNRTLSGGFDQTVWDGIRLFNVTFRANFTRLNILANVSAINTGFINIGAGSLLWRRSVVRGGFFHKCAIDRLESNETRWENTHWKECKIGTLIVDQRSSLTNCTMDASVKRVQCTPLSKQLKLITCGARIESGLHPAARLLQTLRDRMWP